MRQRIALVFFALVLLAGLGLAVPEPPTGLAVEETEEGILISWQHAGGEGVSFNVYRGSTTLDATVLVNISEKFYLDRNIEEGKAYVYYISAVDATGENKSLTWAHIEAAPFRINVIEPSQNAYTAGQTLDFVVAIESDSFDKLQDLKVVLLNSQLGLEQDFSFDSQKRVFSASTVLPTVPEFAGALSTTYIVKATATLDEKEFFQTKPASLLIAPIQTVDTGKFLPPVGLIIVGSMLALLISIVWWRWSLVRKARRDELKLELFEVQKERHLWKHELFKRKITRDQFREKEGELQSKQAAIEEKLGIGHEAGKPRAEPFQGFSPAEASEVMRLVKSIGRPKKGETPEALRARLVGLGRTEKIAKKVAQIVFGK